MTNFSLPKWILPVVLASLTLGLVSCAGGPTYAEVKGKLSPIAKNQGRVFVYRPSGMGFAIKPKVKIDNKEVGQSVGQGFFYTDQAPGTHEISLATEWKHKNTLNVQAGKPSFVHCKVVPGVLVGHIIPNQVDQAEAEPELNECKLTEE